MLGRRKAESTELDLLRPQIWRLVRGAERSHTSAEAAVDRVEVLYEKRIERMT